MVAPQQRPRVPLDEYVTLAEVSVIKLEFIDGIIYAMAGGNPDHAALAANVSTLLSVALGTRKCRVYSSDLRVRIRVPDVITYPDVSVICGKIDIANEDRLGQSALNPTVLVEILSPSTAAYDRGEKLDYYKQIPALQEVMLVDHDSQHVTVHRRTGSGWTAHEFTDTVELASLDVKLAVGAIYRDPLA